MFKKFTIAILISTLSACASVTKSPTEQSNQNERFSFKRQDYVELEADQNKMNVALLEYEHDHNRGNLTDRLLNPMKRSPKIAKYMVDNNLVTLTGDSGYYYANEIALHTVIQSGQVDPYLQNYWDKVMHQPIPHWFHAEFAVGASVWAANTLDHAFSQNILAKYSLHSCPTHDLANGAHIHGKLGETDLVYLALNKCKDYPTDAAKWAGKYLANKNASTSSKTNLIDYMADYYFKQKDYPHAAGYYKLLLELQSTHIELDKLSKLNNAIQLRENFGAGTSIDHFLKNVVGKFYQNEAYKNQKAYTRLNLIRNAGVTNFIDYGL